MHREPRGAESAEIAFGEVRLYVPRTMLRGIVGAVKYELVLTVSAHVFRVKEFEGRFLRLSRISPEAKWNSVFDAFALFQREGGFC